MAWSADNEYRTRVMARGRAVVQLRHPSVAYGLVGLTLLYALGLAAVFWMAMGFADGLTMNALAAPVAVATLATALAIGFRLHRHDESSATSVVVRVGVIWALVGAVWPAVLTGMDLFVGPAQDGDFAHLASSASSLAMEALVGAAIGAIGGIAGGAAAAFLCVERVR